MSDSSDDDRPLGARKVVAAQSRLLISDSDSESPVPEWISQNTPQKSAIQLDDSSDEEPKNTVPNLTQPGKSDKTSKAAEPPRQKATQSIAAAFAKAKPRAKAEGIEPVAAASQQLPPAGASQPIKPVSAVPDAAPGGELPLMLPEKLPGGRFLVELEADANGAADLAGDAGAVGRFTFAGGADCEKEMLLDLKGRIYTTSLVECATTFCVVNLQPNEARVEALLDRYVSLAEEERYNQDDNKHTFTYDDDEADAYQIGEDDKQNQRPGKRKAKEEATDAPKPKKKAPSKPTAAKKKPAAKKGALKGGKKR